MDDEEDDSSSVSQDKREQDLTMLQYIRNMPQTIRYQQKASSTSKDKRKSSSKLESVDFDQISDYQSSQLHSVDDDA